VAKILRVACKVVIQADKETLYNGLGLQ